MDSSCRELNCHLGRIARMYLPVRAEVWLTRRLDQGYTQAVSIAGVIEGSKNWSCWW